MRMWQFCVAGVAALGLVAAGCGGGGASADVSATTSADSDSGAQTAPSGDDGSDGGAGGTVVDPPPPGQATVSVDGQEFSFELPGAVECSLGAEELRFSFRIGDNEVTLGAGANLYESGWLGSINLVVGNPAGEAGPVIYSPAPNAEGTMDPGAFAFEGTSMSYSGPMQKKPANDGTNPPAIDVGEGTITVTCP